MKLVLIESPYWSEDPEIRARNRRYARACMKDSFNRGEAPFASHMLYPQVYPDDNETRAPGAREKGILAGLEWGRRADLSASYEDLGRSRGMDQGIRAAYEQNRPVEIRFLGSDWDQR